MPEPERDIVEVLSELVDSVGTRIKGAEVVRVQSFDRDTNTAEVTPQVLQGSEEQPNVQSVPVIFPGLRWDIQEGEYGLLLIGGLNWRRWWRTGELSAVEDNARHGLTNGILIAGLKPQSGALSIPSKAHVLECAPGGSVRLGVYTADKAALHETLLGDLNSFLAALGTWGGTAHADWTAASAAFTANVSPKITQLVAGIAGGNYQSPTVFVED